MRSVDADIQPHISAMLCFSEAGTKLQPFYIFPRRETTFDELSDLSDIVVSTSLNGYMTTKLWNIWVIYFVSVISQKRENKELDSQHPVILFVDGHSSRLSSFGMRFLSQNNIICIVFPAHTSHVFQPFDVAIGAQLKTYYLSEIINKVVIHFASQIGTASSAATIRRLRVLAFNNAWSRITPTMCMKAFQKAGLARGYYAKEYMEHGNLIADPTTDQDYWSTSKIQPKTLIINGQIATSADIISQLEKYEFRQMVDTKFVYKTLKLKDLQIKLWHLNGISGNSTIGKVFHDIPPIYQNGTNIFHNYRRYSE